MLPIYELPVGPVFPRSLGNTVFPGIFTYPLAKSHFIGYTMGQRGNLPVPFWVSFSPIVPEDLSFFLDISVPSVSSHGTALPHHGEEAPGGFPDSHKKLK
jgi:hypothetical protein